VTAAPRYHGPLLTRPLADALRAARDAGDTAWTGSFDLGRSQRHRDDWLRRIGSGAAQRYPWADTLKDRTLYWWDGDEFAPISRYAGKLIKLVPTEWGRRPSRSTASRCCRRRRPRRSMTRGARSRWCNRRASGAGHLWWPGLFRRLLPGCRRGTHPVVREERRRAVAAHAQPVVAGSRCTENTVAGLQLTHGDVSQAITTLPDAAFDAALHDPPRFGIAGELYSQVFYDQLARVLKRGGRLFHYTGSPNKLTSGRDVPREVAKRLEKAGFRAELALDGVYAVRSAGRSRR
jgi:predicted methyltransferase